MDMISRDIIHRLRQEGKSFRAIGEAVGVSHETARQTFLAGAWPQFYPEAPRLPSYKTLLREWTEKALREGGPMTANQVRRWVRRNGGPILQSQGISGYIRYCVKQGKLTSYGVKANRKIWGFPDSTAA